MWLLVTYLQNPNINGQQEWLTAPWWPLDKVQV